jgi:hypothetical protein
MLPNHALHNVELPTCNLNMVALGQLLDVAVQKVPAEGNAR